MSWLACFGHESSQFDGGRVTTANAGAEKADAKKCP
jgi:hypothetical protein